MERSTASTAKTTVKAQSLRAATAPPPCVGKGGRGHGAPPWAPSQRASASAEGDPSGRGKERDEREERCRGETEGSRQRRRTIGRGRKPREEWRRDVKSRNPSLYGGPLLPNSRSQ